MTFAPIPGLTVIGLGHRARHGKDTAAQAIIRAIAGAERFSFADDLYAICRVHYGMSGKDAPLLQRVGVEYRERYGVEVWVKAVYEKMRHALPRLAVITDVRFPNEFDFVKALGGTTIRVNRYTEHGDLFVDPSRDPNHISEIALADHPWDATLHNYPGMQHAFEEDAILAALAAMHDHEPMAVS